MLSKEEIILVVEDLRRTFEVIEDECKINARSLGRAEIELKTKENSDIGLFAMHINYQTEKLGNWLGILRISLNKILSQEVKND